MVGYQGAGQIIDQHREGCRAFTCLGCPAGTYRDRWCHQPCPKHASAPAAPATCTHHSPLAATASFRTSLFLSSKGLASARITRALYGSSCRTERALKERAGCWLPLGQRFGPPLPLYMQEQAPRCCSSTYHYCGQAGKRMGTAQGSDADSLEQTGVRAVKGAERGASGEGGGPHTMVGLEVRLRNLLTSVSMCRLMI